MSESVFSFPYAVKGIIYKKDPLGLNILHGWSRSEYIRHLHAMLLAPFDDVRTRPGKLGPMSYITQRCALNRIDSVFGLGGWSASYRSDENQDEGKGGYICSLRVHHTLPDGSILSFTTEDVGGCSGMSDDSDTGKSGVADALKRVCMSIGVARYLYNAGTPILYWDDGSLMLPVLYNGPQRPAGSPSPPPPQSPPPQAQRRPYTPSTAQSSGESKPITNGAALYAKVKKGGNDDLLKRIQAWAKPQKLPQNWRDWPSDIVIECFKAFGKEIED